LGEPLTKDLTAQAWRTALDPRGAWVPAVLAAADRRLTEVRRHVGDAGGLVIASDQTAARAYADQLASVSGQRPTLVVSDERGASERIEAFARSTERWMVAVRMVSEGVDIPRLSVGVYATSASTPLFFAQAVGRFVRGRRRGETASIFLPSVPSLLEHAAALEAERDHVLGRRIDGDDLWSAEDALLAQAEGTATESGPDDQLAFEALESEATFDRVLFDGGEFGTHAAAGSDEEEEYLGIPGLLEPDQVVTVLRARQAEQVAARSRRRDAPSPAAPTASETQRALRKELNGLVGAWHHRTGQPHGTIHAELTRSTGGPPAALADAETLQRRVITIRGWAVGRG
jgi:superfamily II DNA or RNA helicase